VVAVREIVEVMYGRSAAAQSIRTLGELRRVVDEGLPKSALKNTVAWVASGPAGAKIIHQLVPRGTYSRRKSLSPAESARTERLARVIATARHVFDDEEAVRRFMTAPHPMLGNDSPLEASYSELGARQVEDLLWQVFYGVTA
jgi:putative toxin-antitoxin system antitoxin component (TIGR02293 family)